MPRGGPCEIVIVAWRRMRLIPIDRIGKNWWNETGYGLASRVVWCIVTGESGRGTSAHPLRGLI